MDRDLQRIAAILTTLAEFPTAPESSLYMFCDMDMTTWGRIKETLINADLISIKGYQVSLTPKGRVVASQIEEAIEGGKG